MAGTFKASSSGSSSAPKDPSASGFSSSAPSRSRSQAKADSDSHYPFRQSVLDMDALLTFAEDHRDADDLYTPDNGAKPRFRRPFAMNSGNDRMFNQQFKSIGHAQEPSPTVKPFDIIHIPMNRFISVHLQRMTRLRCFYRFSFCCRPCCSFCSSSSSL